MLTGRKLLLADDSLTIQKVVDLTFTDEGMNVSAVGAGDQVIEMLEEDAADIVLADVFMPGLSGYEVCERIKRDERFRHIPVLLLVGAFEPFDEAEARRVGADGFLTKPFQSIRGLVNKVGSLLNNRTGEDETAEERPGLSGGMARVPEQSSAEATAPPRPADTATLPSISVDADAGDGRPFTHDSDSVIGEVFTDDAMDDRMIEATPAIEYGGASGSRSTTPLVVAAEAVSGPEANLPREGKELSNPDPLGPELFTSENADHSVQLPYAARMTNASAADDALLDLGEVEPPPFVVEADDFILDLADEAPAPQPRFAETSSAAAAHGEELWTPAPEPASPSAPTTIGSTETLTTEVAIKGDYTSPATGAVGDAAQEDAVARRIDADQLSPEVIDRIARRVVEHLSEKVVREIAWEVVPQLAELLIKRRLEEEESKSRLELR